MPKYYATSKIIENLNNANAKELTNFNTNLDTVLNQFFISTADFTLERWEKEFGIEINNNLNIEFRRTRIKAKMRGQGTVTVSLIKNVAESFSNGLVDVIEDNTNYQFTIKFVSALGIPPNMSDLQKAIEDIKPAHLKALYAFTYNTNNDLSIMTNDVLSGFTHDQLRTQIF
jgi:hypothetical protein